jgi:hypothetical protein
VEIKVGVQHVGRELTLETNETADDLEKRFAQALASDAVLTLTDENGRKVMLPAAKVAYIDLGQEHARRVGFGAV